MKDDSEQLHRLLPRQFFVDILHDAPHRQALKKRMPWPRGDKRHAPAAVPHGDNRASQASAASVCLQFGYNGVLIVAGFVTEARFQRDYNHALTLFAQVRDPKTRHL
jgi:hypothetical protein